MRKWKEQQKIEEDEGLQRIEEEYHKPDTNSRKTEWLKPHSVLIIYGMLVPDLNKFLWLVQFMYFINELKNVCCQSSIALPTIFSLELNLPWAIFFFKSIIERICPDVQKSCPTVCYQCSDSFELRNARAARGPLGSMWADEECKDDAVANTAMQYVHTMISVPSLWSVPAHYVDEQYVVQFSWALCYSETHPQTVW